MLGRGELLVDADGQEFPSVFLRVPAAVRRRREFATYAGLIVGLASASGAQ